MQHEATKSTKYARRSSSRAHVASREAGPDETSAKLDPSAGLIDTPLPSERESRATRSRLHPIPSCVLRALRAFVLHPIQKKPSLQESRTHPIQEGRSKIALSRCSASV